MEVSSDVICSLLRMLGSFNVNFVPFREKCMELQMHENHDFVLSGIMLIRCTRPILGPLNTAAR